MGDMACHILGAPIWRCTWGAPTSVVVHSQGGSKRLHVSEEVVIAYDFPARGSMPPVKLFWNDGLTETPKIPGYRTVTGWVTFPRNLLPGAAKQRSARTTAFYRVVATCLL